MATVKKKAGFMSVEQRAEIEQTLRQMAMDGTYNTRSSYCANSELYPDNLMPFVDKHMNYLKSHPELDPKHYIANLRMMTLVR